MSVIYVAGNWKLNNSPGETEEFMKNLAALKPEFEDKENEVEAIICPPSLSLERACNHKPPWLLLGSQDVYYEEKGAYTGEDSPTMLCELDVGYVIVGHSERRKIFGETDESINKKINKLLELELTPILCVGEDEKEREKGVTFPVIELQLKKGLCGTTKNGLDNLLIAYEPVWAIGTGKSATAKDAEEAGKFIKDTMVSLGASPEVPVLYGGSVNPENIGEFVSQDNIEGVLVGGKSVNSDSYKELLEKASEASL